MSSRRVKNGEIDPDDILLDARNLPSFDLNQFEGQIEKPISKSSSISLGIFCIFVILLILTRTGYLQILKGDEFRERSQNNSLHYISEYAPRGNIYDRNGVRLAWSDNGRKYISLEGLGHILGYVGYPRENELLTDKYEPKEMVGIDGVEYAYNEILEGIKGKKYIETDALGKILTEAVHITPEQGKDLNLSIDSRLQNELYKSISVIANERNFTGGAGILMDINTGEIIALTSYPEYEPKELSPGSEPRLKLSEYFNDKRLPFLNRAVNGLYTPGSVVKPIIALGALEEKIISPTKRLLSSGELRLPNPYNPGEDSVFKDWKAHGLVDMRNAISVSSDEYFYIVGGGYKTQSGLGIANIEKYSRMFGLAEKTGISLKNEPEGTIPSPEWKAKHFDGEPWRIGDTYHTAIGQYGYQITPLQMVRATAAIANYGKLLYPQLVHPSSTEPQIERSINISSDKFNIVHDGMRLSATIGTGTGLNASYVEFAVKTGTAELGVSKAYVNSWVTGFFPYKKPKYAFVVVMEHGKRTNTIGATAVARRFFDSINQIAPEYFD
ncbi:MAG: hypothetical protein HZA95_01225 [Candidatus Vogelbacteria bacterium]|nr:hypothetical protein [Candidatus Vogelbacteria bacterium]